MLSMSGGGGAARTPLSMTASLHGGRSMLTHPSSECSFPSVPHARPKSTAVCTSMMARVALSIRVDSASRLASTTPARPLAWPPRVAMDVLSLVSAASSWMMLCVFWPASSSIDRAYLTQLIENKWDQLRV